MKKNIISKLLCYSLFVAFGVGGIAIHASQAYGADIEATGRFDNTQVEEESLSNDDEEETAALSHVITETAGLNAAIDDTSSFSTETAVSAGDVEFAADRVTAETNDVSLGESDEGDIPSVDDENEPEEAGGISQDGTAETTSETSADADSGEDKNDEDSADGKEKVFACGDNAYCKISPDHTIATFYGEGATYNYGRLTGYAHDYMSSFYYGEWEEWDAVTPWDEWNDTITKVIIEDGITEIGTHCCCFPNLSVIEWGNTVRELQPYAFYSESMYSVVFPDSLQVLHANSFITSCSEITFGKEIREINPYAFVPEASYLGVNDVKSNIPGAISCNINAFYATGTCENYTAVDGVLYSKDLSTLVLVPPLHAAEDNRFVTAPWITSVANSAFLRTTYSEYVFTENVDEIDAGVFQHIGADIARLVIYGEPSEYPCPYHEGGNVASYGYDQQITYRIKELWMSWETPDGFTMEVSGPPDNGVLTVSGKGAMTANLWYWKDYGRLGVSTVVLKKGVTGINRGLEVFTDGIDSLWNMLILERADGSVIKIYLGDVVWEDFERKVAQVPIEYNGILLDENDYKITNSTFYGSWWEESNTTISFKGSYAKLGEITLPWPSKGSGIGDPIYKFSLSADAFYYDGTVKMPSVSVSDGFNMLREGIDYRVVYHGKPILPGQYRIEIFGLGKTESMYDVVTFRILPRDINTINCYLPVSEMTYTGEYMYPVPYIEGLNRDTDYTVNYSENCRPGEGHVIIKGIGNYTGTRVLPFSIKEEKTAPQKEETQGKTGKDKPTEKKAEKAAAELDETAEEIKPSVDETAEEIKPLVSVLAEENMASMAPAIPGVPDKGGLYWFLFVIALGGVLLFIIIAKRREQDKHS